jgi:hypothetical protein
MRMSNPTLFLAICSVGARFWDIDNEQLVLLQHISRSELNFDSLQQVRGLHPRFFDLTSLLDKAVSRLMLQPTPADVTLDSIRVLLLYAQWMPCSKEDDSTMSQQPLPKSRYNDISAWAVLGLAFRYASFLGLDRLAITPFQGQAKSLTEDDFSRLRVLYNLVTCDVNLMVTSGLPASLNPAPAASVAQVFGSHRMSQQPGDLRSTALVELGAIVHRATKSGREFSRRQLDAFSLRKANTDLDDWERLVLEPIRL